jgi:hypothetical protein
MAGGFYLSLKTAIFGENVRSVVVLLESSDHSLASLSIEFYKRIADLGKNCTDGSLNKALFRYLFLPTSKGEYPIILLTKEVHKNYNNEKLKKILSCIDGYADQGTVAKVLLTLDKRHETTLRTILSLAGDGLKGIIFHIVYHYDVDKDVRDAVTLWAAGANQASGYKREYRSYLAKHNYTLGELDKLSDLACGGLFVMLFLPDYIPIGDYKPPKKSKSSDMVYLRYLYENGVPSGEWGKLRSILVKEDGWGTDVLLALKVFCKYHQGGDTANILKYLSNDSCYIEDKEVHLYPVGENDMDSFFHQCLSEHKELAYAAAQASYLRRTSTSFYLDVMMDLFSELDTNTPVNNTFLIGKAIREMMDVDDYLYRCGDKVRRALMPYALRKINGLKVFTYGYIRCLGGKNAVIKVERYPYYRIPKDTLCIPGICCVFSTIKLYVDGVYGDVYGQKIYGIKQGDSILFVEKGKFYDFKDVIVYDTYEDALKAPFDPK